MGVEVIEPWPYSQFSEDVDKGTVKSVTFSGDGQSLLVESKDGSKHVVQALPNGDKGLLNRLNKANVAYGVNADTGMEDAAAGAAGLLSGLFIPLLLFAGLFFLSKRGGEVDGDDSGSAAGPQGGIFNMGKTRSKMDLEPDTGVKFVDVAGCEQSKSELREIVEFLKKPDKFTDLGARIPKGVIMEGPPGTGKTLLARAVAGEAEVPFMRASGSEFVEMFVGVGAARVRDMFEKAKKNAPCIIFIDEIDAVGKSRQSGGLSGANDEREQTLNQILTEMDGFEGNTGVIVMAATNRADVLDAALTRPGRFDRRIPVVLPDQQGRVEILKVHVKNKPLARDLDLSMVGKRTIGFSGADLANLMNEAAILSARRDKTQIGMDEVEAAIDRLTVGQQKPHHLAQTTQTLVAYHEAGHTLMSALTPGYDMVSKVTIIPSSNGAGGMTVFVPDEERLDSGLYTRTYMNDQLAVALGGRVAEEVVYGLDETTTGASSDLQRVRSIARNMVTRWGFAGENDMGFTAWEPMQDTWLGREANSPQMETTIDQELY